MPPTHRYRFAGCRTRRTDACEASARFWRGRAFSPAGPYDLTAGAQEGPGAQVTHVVMGAVHRPGQAGPPPHDRGAGAAGPLLLVVPTDSATSAAPRPCAVPQTLGQDQRRGVLAGQVLEGDVDCALRAPIARRRRPTRRQGDAVTSQIDRSRSGAASRRRRTSVPHSDTDRSVPRRTRSHESVDRCGLPTEVAACDARAAGLDRDLGTTAARDHAGGQQSCRPPASWLRVEPCVIRGQEPASRIVSCRPAPQHSAPSPADGRCAAVAVNGPADGNGSSSSPWLSFT